jgi:anti-sigma regulatory factor (Ser/Thr protein kinase)
VTVGHQDQDSQELQLTAEAGSVGVARRAASEFAERRGVDAEAVALAVSETVTNAVVHAYRDDSDGEIVITLSPNGDGIVVTVADSGGGIRPNPDSPGLGYGLPLVASVADEVGIARSPGGGTAVKMRFLEGLRR